MSFREARRTVHLEEELKDDSSRGGSKVFKSMGTVNKVREFGGIKTVIVMAARRAGFPFGFPCGAFHFVRGWRGPMAMEYADTKRQNAPAEARRSRSLQPDVGREKE